MTASPFRGFVIVAILLLGTSALPGLDPQRPPNVVILLADDLGYSDLGCYGAREIRTPNLDRMAKEGTRFTRFTVSQAVCTASRASLMTGCYANRVSLAGALNHESRVGIHANELLLPEVMKQRGYATAIYGKWHLGHRPQFLPTRHGFDEWSGIPYSNDNGPLHPIMRDIPALPWFENERITEKDPDQSQFTKRLTEKAVDFIARNRARPFFLYVPHIMPHVPIFASKEFRGRSKVGLYGDVVEELDWSVGEILQALKKHGVDEQTLVIFFSDNGPFLSYGTHAGSAKPLREGKLTTFEGGVRVPFMARWPKHVPSNQVTAAHLASIDLLPTLAKLVGGKLPTHPLDGQDCSALLLGKSREPSPRENFLYYSGQELQAVRKGKWKLHLPHEFLTVAGPTRTDGKPANFENLKPESMAMSGIRGIASRHGYRVQPIDLSLFNLDMDEGETTNVAQEHPEVVKELLQLAEQARTDLGDSLTKRVGKGVRASGSESQ